MFRRIYNRFRDSITDSVHNRLQYELCAQFLQRQALSCSSLGITNNRISNEEIIVSLTTHGRRLFEVYLAIESIMQGSVLPNRIVLWLPTTLKSVDLPQTLLNQCRRGLEIYFVEDIGPYTKSVPAFSKFPKASIVTIDDDILYPFDTLEMLLYSHHLHATSICANRILDVEFERSGELKPLSLWKEMTDKTRVSSHNFFEGVGGVLYPPSFFSKEDTDPHLFLRLCPKADDVWLNVLALHHKYAVVPANSHYIHFPLLINESVQDLALWHFNSESKVKSNDKQLKAALQFFSLSFE